jgi:hypothetical protein
LIVCHAAPKTLPFNPLFPHQTGDTISATATAEHHIIEAVTRQVVDSTGFAKFDVIVDLGEPSSVICAQATRLQADLVIVSADRPGVGKVARDLSTSPCSVLVLGASEGDAIAIVTLESEVGSIAVLVEAARGVVLRPVSKFIVIMWVDSDERKTPLLAELERTSRAVGVPFEPWFANLADQSAFARAASDPQIGLVALIAPAPDKIVARRASPLDDGFEGATASFLLLRR